MKRTVLNSIVCLLSVVLSVAVVVCSAHFVGSGAELEKTAVKYLENEKTVANLKLDTTELPSEKEQAVEPEVDLAAAEERLVAMLNMNYCYGACFEDEKELSIRAAIALMDYCQEVEGYGFGVNASLVAGFMKSFYGVEVDPGDIADQSGYVMIPSFECGTVLHTPVSITEEAGVITVVTCAEIYDGGEMLDTFLAKSEFVKDEVSEFGFNLKFSELL